jgi:K+-sensing histidine kinase KdpD
MPSLPNGSPLRFPSLFVKEDWKPFPFFLPAFWVALALVILIGDYLSGPTIQFPILYLIPVSLASWYSGFKWGLVFAVTMPLIRLYYFVTFWPLPLTGFGTVINTVIRILVLGGAAYLVSRMATQTKELAKRVNVLEGFLPICSFCKKIRDQQDNWQPLERYISDRSNAQFTHGCCPECEKRYYSELLKKTDRPGQDS